LTLLSKPSDLDNPEHSKASLGKAADTKATAYEELDSDFKSI